MSSRNEDGKEDSLKKLYKLFAIIFLVWLLSLVAIIFIPFENWSTRGTFGDSFGSINSLFSGLALGGIIYTIFLQKKELSLQRNELKETREEFTIQNRTLRLQRFENTFFNLLSLHHNIIDSIDLDIEKPKEVRVISQMRRPAEYDRIILKGRDVFKENYEKLLDNFEPNEINLDIINSEYMKFYESVQTDFGHYFRNLYRIIKLVDETEFHTHQELEASSNAITHLEMLEYTLPNYNTKYKYTSIIRSQLSDYELLWLFYNCLSDNGNEKFKPYIEEYSLLKNLPKDKLHNEMIDKEYEVSAFEKK